MNILHLIPDEKFICFFNSIFSELTGVTNRYIVLQTDPTVPLKYIASLDPWRLVGNSYFFSNDMRQDLTWCDCLILHNMTSKGAYMAMKAPPDVAIVWSGWGHDYYDFFPGREQALLNGATLKIVQSLNARSSRRDVRGLLQSVKSKLLREFIVLRCFKKVDFFSAPIPDDFKLLRSSLGSRFKAEYVQLNYGNVPQTFLPGSEKLTGKDILVGNSATPTNNHVEVFKLLSDLDLRGHKVIAPLSYGDERYRDAIIKLGKHLLGDQFEPITEILPLDAYNSLIARCSVVFMNHRRQQALGNIGAMLQRGAKVYLDERNVVYQFLKKRGAHVFSTIDFTKSQGHLFEPLDEFKVLQNREVLEAFWGDDIVRKNAMCFIDRIEKYRLAKLTERKR